MTPLDIVVIGIVTVAALSIPVILKWPKKKE